MILDALYRLVNTFRLSDGVRAVLVVGLATLAMTQGVRADHVPFRVMTYNVRKQVTQDTGFYTWADRRQNVIQLIENNDPDIFGLQEANGASMIDDLMAGLVTNHAYNVYQPPGLTTPKMIFYRKTRFELVPNSAGAGNLGICSEVETFQRTFTYVKLEDLMSGQKYFVLNAHFAAGGLSCTLARENAATVIVERIKQSSGGLPIILLGDLNIDTQEIGDTPAETSGFASEDTINILENGASYDNGGHFNLYRSERHTGATSDKYATANFGRVSGVNSGWDTVTVNDKSRKDYIFTSGEDLTTYGHTIDKTFLDGPSSGTNLISPSDHYGVVATVRHAIFIPSTVVDYQGDDPSNHFYFADVNGDGFVDKISWSPSISGGKTHTYMGDGSGHFGTAVTSSNGWSMGNATYWFPDVTGDGCADRVYWNPGNDQNTRIYPGLCNGTFSAYVSSTGGTAGTQFYWARVNADACDDKIVWNPSLNSGKVTVYFASCNGTATFGSAIVNGDLGKSTNSNAKFYFAHVDSDGLADKIMWDPAANSGKTQIYFSNGTGQFPTSAQHGFGSSAVNSTKYYFYDVDADGLADKIFWRDSHWQGRPQIYLGTGTNFDSRSIMNNANFSESPVTEYFFADVDGNGSADQIYRNPENPEGATRVNLSFYCYGGGTDCP